MWDGTMVDGASCFGSAGDKDAARFGLRLYTGTKCGSRALRREQRTFTPPTCISPCAELFVGGREALLFYR